MKSVYVKPAPGLRVRHEQAAAGRVPDDGAHVPRTAYYRRRMRDGDLVRAKAPPAPAPDPAAKSPPSRRRND